MRFWKVGALALAAMVCASSAWAGDVGKPARDFTITTLDKQTFRLADLKGKVVVVNRWATWCTPCKAEMIVFDKYIRTHPDADLKLFAVTTELQFPASQLKPLQAHLHYPMATSISGWGYGIKGAVPTTYVIDRAGIVRHAEAGAFNDENFDALMTKLLAEPASDAAAH
jgi:peroxiredoxin